MTCITSLVIRSFEFIGLCHVLSGNFLVFAQSNCDITDFIYVFVANVVPQFFEALKRL